MFKRIIAFVVLMLPAGLHAQLGSPAATPTTQESSYSFFYGYSANVPHEYIGVELGQFGSGKLGWQMELKLKAYANTPQPTGFEQFSYSMTGNTYENRMNFDVAFNYGVSSAIVVYVGGGIARWDSAQEIYVSSKNAFGWIVDDRSPGVNILGGVMFRLAPIYLKIGFDSNPGGLAVGLGLGG